MLGLIIKNFESYHNIHLYKSIFHRNIVFPTLPIVDLLTNFRIRYATGREECRLTIYTSFIMNEVNVCVPTVLSDFHSLSMNCYINGITRWLTVGVNFVTYALYYYRLLMIFAHCNHMYMKKVKRWNSTSYSLDKARIWWKIIYLSKYLKLSLKSKLKVTMYCKLSTC